MPAVLAWTLLGLLARVLPLNDPALILVAVYGMFYGLVEASGHAHPSPPSTNWQVPSAWVMGRPRWRRTMTWGSVLGPGFATRNPYAGFGLLPLTVAAVGDLRYGVLLAAAIGAAHGIGRAVALLRSVHAIAGHSYLRSVMRSMYWRAFDGYSLLVVAGVSTMACVYHF